MVLISVLCPHCQSDQVIKGGKTKASKQRYKCQNSDCPCYLFQRASGSIAAIGVCSFRGSVQEPHIPCDYRRLALS
jgi:InsA N-terminal domain